MATYRELQDTINSDYLNRDLGDATKRAITRAIRKHEHRRMWFNETATAVTTVANRSYIPVPADYLTFDRLEVNVSGSVDQLLEEDLTFIRAMNMNSQNGYPTYFTYYGDRFELASVPDSAYAVTVYYVHTLPALSADSDSNVWTNEAFNLIAHEATVDLLANVLQVSDPMKISTQKAERDEALTRFNELVDQRTVATLTKTDF